MGGDSNKSGDKLGDARMYTFSNGFFCVACKGLISVAIRCSCSNSTAARSENDTFTCMRYCRCFGGDDTMFLNGEGQR